MPTVTFTDVFDVAHEHYSVYLYGLIVITSLLCLLWDAPTLEQEGIRRDAAFLRIVGIMYLAVGTLTFVATHVLFRVS